jgi:Uma2 family endonuclease
MVTMTKFTRADYLALPEGYPAQLIDGMLVKSPSPTWGHQRVVLDLASLLQTVLPPDRVAVAPIDVPVDEHNVLQPDVLVTPAPQSLDAKDAGVPLLVIEVLSPSTRRYDRKSKSRHYLEIGVGEVWLVDFDQKSIEIRTRQSSATFSGEAPARSSVVPGFEIVPRTLAT